MSFYVREQGNILVEGYANVFDQQEVNPVGDVVQQNLDLGVKPPVMGRYGADSPDGVDVSKRGRQYSYYVQNPDKPDGYYDIISEDVYCNNLSKYEGLVRKVQLIKGSRI